MSKYNESHIVTMLTWIVLIILGISQVIFSNSLSNISNNDVYSIYPMKLFRIKRNYGTPEYTRWRAKEETKDEFIVKVLDDDIVTPYAKSIVAINIEPKVKNRENIIVGGVIVPQRPNILSTSTESFKDYTRFVPPTTGTVKNVDGNLYLQPAPLLKNINKLSPILPRVEHGRVQNLQRDDSPPASPQFLARTSNIMARQYAPIAQVAFKHGATYSPLTPPFKDSHMLHKPFGIPSRTTSLIQIAIPTRTRSTFEEIQSFIEDKVTPKDTLLTRTTSVHLSEPKPTSRDEFEFSSSNNGIVLSSDQKILLEADRNKNKQKTDDIFLDMSYNNQFNADEDNDEKEKKNDETIIGDIYFDKTGIDDNNLPRNDFFNNEPEYANITCPGVITNSDVNQIEEYDRTVKVDHPASRNISISRQTIKEIKRDKHHRSCSMLKLRQLNFNSPRTLAEIIAQLKQWSEESPVAKRTDITEGNFTTMENPIYMMIVDDPTSGQIISAKQTVMIVAGVQGRDHHAVAAAMYVLYQLIERSEVHADLLTKYRFWIIPVFNPDGYDYSMKFPHRREWKKNLRQTWDVCKGRESCYTCEAYGLRCTIKSCYGVHLDRNFEYQWIPADELQAEHPCGELYAGTMQLSEPETYALTHYLREQRTTLFAFIAFKEGDLLGVMYPYSHTRKKRAFDHIYRQRASRAASAAFSISGRPYMAGQTSEFLPLYAGGIEDWVDGHLGIDNTYTIMMFRPTDAYNSKLITEIVHEAYAATDTLLLQSVEPLAPQITLVTKFNIAAVLTSNRLIILLLIVICKHLA